MSVKVERHSQSCPSLSLEIYVLAPISGDQEFGQCTVRMACLCTMISRFHLGSTNVRIWLRQPHVLDFSSFPRGMFWVWEVQDDYLTLITGIWTRVAEQLANNQYCFLFVYPLHMTILEFLTKMEVPGNWTSFFFFFFFNLFYFWLRWVFIAVCGLFSSCRQQGLLFIAVRGLLIAAASLVVEHGL